MNDEELQAIYRRGLDESQTVALRAVFDAGVESTKSPVPAASGAPVTAKNAPWQGNTTYADGDVVSSVKDGHDNLYACTQPGTSGNFEPTWTKKTTRDGTVVWTAL